MKLPPVHRVVTGHAADGRAIVSDEGAPPTVVELASVPGTVFYELWATEGSPARVDNGADPTVGPLRLPPPPNGTRVRIVDIPPDTPELLARAAASKRDAFAEIGDAAAGTAGANSPHPLMHRTETVDYGMVLEGEVTLVLDDSEVQLRKGSVVIQRGTNHAWANRSGRVCRMLFVLVDGKYTDEIAGPAAYATRSGEGYR